MTSPASFRFKGWRRAEASGAARTVTGAFTLMEVLLASVASAVILASIYTVFSSAVHLRNGATDRIHHAQARARAENAIRKDLRAAYLSGSTTGAAMVLTAAQQSPHNSQFPGYLQFTTTNAELSDDSPGGDVQEIEYYVTKGADPAAAQSGSLVRTVTRNVLSTTTASPIEQTILNGVTALDVSFFDGSQWSNSWQYAQQGDPIPVGIRVRIELAPGAGTASEAPIDITIPWGAQPFSAAAPAAATPAPTRTGS